VRGSPGALQTTAALYGAPLCPAGHLPHKEGDWPSPGLSLIANVAGISVAPNLLISPQVGEMSGRTEGGAVERGLTSPGCWVWALDMKKKVGYAPDI
jgi:hypothetical protein